MLRASSYTIYVDLPHDRERMLLVHGYTGAHDVVSRPVATFVRQLETRRPPRPLYGAWKDEVDSETGDPPSDQTIEILRRHGYLTTLSPEEEMELVARCAENLQRRAQAPAYALVTDYDCNLRCSYCFQSHMRHEPSFRRLLGPMPPAVIDRTFEAIRSIEESFGREAPGPGTSTRKAPFRFGLFGGEPLLRTNRPTVEHIFDKAAVFGPTSVFTITNGTEIDAYEDLIGPKGISFLQITLDGPPAVHDSRRIYEDGKGSYAKIASNIDMALARGAFVSVRVNIDRTNLHGLAPLAEEVARSGWVEHPNFSIYAAVVRAENDETDPAVALSAWKLKKLTDLDRELQGVSRIIRSPDDQMKRHARRVLDCEPLAFPSFKASFCTANNGMFIFDAWGHVYACFERLADPVHRVGSVGPDGKLLLDETRLSNWRSRNISRVPSCSRCRYALLCGGGCTSQAEQRSKTFLANHCDDFRNRYRAALAEAFEEKCRDVPAEPVEPRSCEL